MFLHYLLGVADRRLSQILSPTAATSRTAAAAAVGVTRTEKEKDRERERERERDRPTKPLKLLSLVFHRLQRVRERIRSQRQRGFREKKNSRRKGAADTFCLPLRSSGKTRKYQYSATPQHELWLRTLSVHLC